MKVGDTIWVYDMNRRVYRKDGLGGPIYREHWRPETIFGETPRSWLYGISWKPSKLAKNKPLPPGIAVSEEELDRLEFVHDHAYKISELLRRCATYDQLKQVAEIIGYKPDAKQ